MCINPINVIINGEEKTVKCGKCILCRMKKCRNWALRLFHESQYYNKMCMITLTFRPKFLLTPKFKTLKRSHTVKEEGTTRKKIIYEKYTTMISPKYITDVKLTGWLITLFIKKLRKELSKTNRYISYFAVGEHGSQNTHRAHWHIIFFGINKEDIKSVCVGKSKKNKEIYYSPLIDKLWAYDKIKIGNHTISDVTTATIKYVANYTMKKMYKNEHSNYPWTMRFSNQNKVGIKWARRYHKELRKEYLQDNDGNKYAIPNSYYNEMIRYQEYLSNEDMNQTAIIIEQNKDELIKKLKNSGMLNKDEIMKKAKRIEYRNKMMERDTF